MFSLAIFILYLSQLAIAASDYPRVQDEDLALSSYFKKLNGKPEDYGFLVSTILHMRSTDKMAPVVSCPLQRAQAFCMQRFEYLARVYNTLPSFLDCTKSSFLRGPIKEVIRNMWETPVLRERVVGEWCDDIMLSALETLVKDEKRIYIPTNPEDIVHYATVHFLLKILSVRKRGAAQITDLEEDFFEWHKIDCKAIRERQKKSEIDLLKSLSALTSKVPLLLKKQDDEDETYMMPKLRVAFRFFSADHALNSNMAFLTHVAGIRQMQGQYLWDNFQNYFFLSPPIEGGIVLWRRDDCVYGGIIYAITNTNHYLAVNILSRVHNYLPPEGEKSKCFDGTGPIQMKLPVPFRANQTRLSGWGEVLFLSLEACETRSCIIS